MSRHHDAVKNDPRYKAWQEQVVSLGACEDCGSEADLTADHIVPISRGGEPFDPDNGRCLCRRCNSRKGNRTEPIRANYYNPKYLAHL